MAFYLITGRLQQGSNVCKNKFTKRKLHAVYKITQDVCHYLLQAQAIHSRAYSTSQSHSFEYLSRYVTRVSEFA